MGLGGKMTEAQELLDWAIVHLNGSIRCKVIDHKYENYRVQFFTKENKLIMPFPFLISEEWVRESNPKEHFIHDRLKTLLRSLEDY